jgi:hypothetical protein
VAVWRFPQHRLGPVDRVTVAAERRELCPSGRSLPDGAGVSQISVYPANLCSFSGHVEFSGFSDDFDESVGEAAENAAR